MKPLNQYSDLVMVLFAIGILFMLFLPIPKGLLDTLLILNFSWALTILLLTFYTDKPLSFSTFPSLLLLSTLFRLALNISATRLILNGGDAGRVITAMGNIVINGNYVMGMVVFLILIVVQFIVVTNGAQRIAEVAARFTLDSLPGKQMSIDADLNMGIVTHEEAKERRSQIEREANFYGAMDGASKFVKGDAIAGILIMAINILGGLVIGLLQLGLSFNDALHRYTLLTVGDGLVTQIPALIISTATGIIVTRAATDAELGASVMKQLTTSPKSLVMVGVSLLLLLSVKSIPILPVLVSLTLIALALKWTRSKDAIKADTTPPSLIDKIRIYPIDIQLSTHLTTVLRPMEPWLLANIETLRETIAYEYGLIMPAVHFSENKTLESSHFRLFIQGSLTTQGQLNTADALESQLMRRLKGTVLTHLSELLDRQSLITRLKDPEFSTLSEELMPNLLNLGQVQLILQKLLKENISIRPLRQILECLLTHAKHTPDINLLNELLRAKLAGFICHRLTQNQQLPVIMISPALESTIAQNIINDKWAVEPAITERLLSSLTEHIEKALKLKKPPVLLCSSPLRRHIRQITERILPTLTILGMNEIPVDIHVESVGVIN